MKRLLVALLVSLVPDAALACRMRADDRPPEDRLVAAQEQVKSNSYPSANFTVRNIVGNKKATSKQQVEASVIVAAYYLNGNIEASAKNALVTAKKTDAKELSSAIERFAELDAKMAKRLEKLADSLPVETVAVKVPES